MSNDIKYCSNTLQFPKRTLHINRGKDVVSGAKVNLIFWGSKWHLKSHQRVYQQFVADVKTILASSYLRELQQYGISMPARFNGQFLIDNSDPNDRYTEKDLTAFIAGMIGEGKLVSPDKDDKYLHCVIMPKGIMSSNEVSNDDGIHVFPPYSGSTKKLYIICLPYAARNIISTNFSHELVEACTNPGGKGVTLTFDRANLGDENEIADVCELATPIGAKINGVKVQSYWSDKAQSCVVPI